MSMLLPVINDHFRGPSEFCKPGSADYKLLPFHFEELDEHRYVAVNFGGDYIVLAMDQLKQLISHTLSHDDPLYSELVSRQFILDPASPVSLDLLATQYRTRYALLPEFTSLFLFVVSLRCDHSCPYCQVSRQSTDRSAFDMTPEIADKALCFVENSPAHSVKIEFQGGEPLLNFELIKYIVNAATTRPKLIAKDVQFVITTNLAYLSEEVLDFCAANQVFLSTSLDGPQDLHNANRPRPGGNSHELAVDGIRRIRQHLGPDKISALMTTTHASLTRVREIIDEYLAQGFSSIFLRWLSPYGFATKTRAFDKYRINQWLDFYFDGLEYVLELNRSGVSFREEYASILVRKILTSFPNSYVDLQSPAGIGVAAIAFNYDGFVYASDESRMLAEMGDTSFQLGHLLRESYQQIMTSPRLMNPLLESMVEGAPMCSDCAFQQYCGADPVYHHATQGDSVGHKLFSDHCGRTMAIVRRLIRILEDRPEDAGTLRSWAY